MALKIPRPISHGNICYGVAEQQPIKTTITTAAEVLRFAKDGMIF
jgi:hypothetical protein